MKGGYQRVLKMLTMKWSNDVNTGEEILNQTEKLWHIMGVLKEWVEKCRRLAVGC
jgi:hypothetical protein